MFFTTALSFRAVVVLRIEVVDIMSKRKRSRSGDPLIHKPDPPTCILHISSISDHGRFTSFCNVKGDAAEKLNHIHTIRDRRLSQPHESPYRMKEVCDHIPATLPDDLESVGYHRQCYQRFTANLHLLGDERPTEVEASTSQRHHSPRKISSIGPIFPPECIFCDKLEVKGGDRKTERTEYFSYWKNKENAWQHIESRAEKMGLDRLHRLVKNKDLFAVEAKHHPSCFKSFRTAFANHERGIRRAEGPKDTQHARMSAAHEKALIVVVENIKMHVVQRNEILRLSSLRQLYVEELERNGYENEKYRAEKLLKRLQSNQIKDHVSFTKVPHSTNNALSFWLVHSSVITVADAIAQAYVLGSADKYQDVALLLRRSILQAFDNSKALPWPPTADNMELSSEELLPPDLVRFLKMVMVGKDEVENKKLKCDSISNGDN